MSSSSRVLLDKGSPGRLAYVTSGSCQARANARIRRGRGKYAAAIDFGCVQQQAAVGRKTGRFVQSGIGQRDLLAASQVERLHLELVVATAYVDQHAPVRAQAWRYVVVAGEGYALHVTAGEIHTIDLRSTAAVGREVD